MISFRDLKKTILAMTINTQDNRYGDKSQIHMGQLVQMTLYQFDKLLLKANI